MPSDHDTAHPVADAQDAEPRDAGPQDPIGQLMNRLPAPVAFPYSRVDHERSFAQKLQHLMTSYGNLLRFAVILGLARILEEQAGDELVGAELRQMTQPGPLDWVETLDRVTKLLPFGDPVGRVLGRFHRTLEVEKRILVREIVDLKMRESHVGLLANLAKFQAGLPRRLGDLDDTELARSFTFAQRSYGKVLAEAEPLADYPLVVLDDRDETAVLRALSGPHEQFEAARCDVPEGLPPRRVHVLRPDDAPLDLHPLAVFTECYDCLKENPQGAALEAFFYQGHSGRRIYYQGTRHRIATHELLAEFGRRIAKGDGAAARPIEDPVALRERLDSQAQAAVVAARQGRRYRPGIYVTRKAAEHELRAHLLAGGPPVMLVAGHVGSGKSTLLDRLTDQLPGQGHLVVALPVEDGAETPAELFERHLGLTPARLFELAGEALTEDQRLVLLVDGLDRGRQAALLGPLLELADRVASDAPFARWVVTLRTGMLAQLERTGDPLLAHAALRRHPWAGLGGREQRARYDLPPLDARERAALFEAASRHADVPAKTPLHLLKRSAQELLGSPDALLLMLDAYRGREISSSVTLERILARYRRKIACNSEDRETLLGALIKAMGQARRETASVDDLIDAGDQKVSRELLAPEGSQLIEGLIEDGVLVRQAVGHGVFSEERLSFGHPLLAAYLTAERLDSKYKRRELLELPEKPLGLARYFEPLCLLFGRCLEERDFDMLVDVARSGGPAMGRVLGRLLAQEELNQAGRGADARRDPVGPLARKLSETPLGAEALLGLAEERMAAGEADRARSMLEVLQSSPIAGDRPLELYVGRAQLATGDAKVALKTLRRAEKRLRGAPPELDLQVVRALAEAQVASGLAAKAEAAVRKLFDRLQVAEARELLVPCRLLLSRVVAGGDAPAQAVPLYQRALETAVQDNRPRLELEIRDELAQLLERLDQRGDAAKQLGRLVAMAARGGDRAAQAGYLVRLSRLLVPDDGEEREKALDEAMALAGDLGPSEVLAEASLEQARLHDRRGRLEEAMTAYRQAIETAQLFTLEPLLAAAHNELGSVLQTRGDFPRALECYSKSLELRKRLDDRLGLASTYHNLGLIFRALGDGQRAIDYFTKSVEIKDRTGDALGRATTWTQLAVLLAARGDDAEAARILRVSRETFEAAKDEVGLAGALFSEGLIEQERGDNEHAQGCYERCQTLQERAGDERGLSATYNQLALIHKSRGDEYKALKLFQQAATILERLGDRRGLSACYNNIGVIHDGRGEIEQAQSYYEKDLAISEELGDLPGIATSYQNLAILYYGRRNYVRALFFLEKARDAYVRAKDDASVEVVEEKIARVKAKM